jgi:hypothetical protein
MLIRLSSGKGAFMAKRHRGFILCSIALAPLCAASLSGAQPRRNVVPLAKLDRIPIGTMSQMTDRTKAIGYPRLTWPNRVVTVAFNGGDPALYALVESTASEWTSQGGRLAFSFRRADGGFRTWREADVTRTADIRIGFFTDRERDGYWSAVGTLARRINASEPTMNLGDLGSTLSKYYNGANRAAWQQTYARTIILHEFGHALGLNHEHFHPHCQADLKLEETLNWLMGEPARWSREQAMFNMDAATYFKAMQEQGPGPIEVSPSIDRRSVMLYTFSSDYFRSGVRSPCLPASRLGYATSISEDDRRYFLANYGLAQGPGG